MNYQWHYDRLISTRKERAKEEGKYYEKHHILPRSMGGSDDESNLVYLTAREHFLAHWLLWRIHRNRETAGAFHLMCSNRFYFHGKPLSSRIFEESREAAAVSASYVTSQRNKKFWSSLSFEERSEKITSMMISKIDQKKKGEKRKAVWDSLTREEKESIFSKQRRTKTLKNHDIRKEKFEAKQLKINSGNFRNYPQISCPKCNQIGKSGVMKRWHFENCKK